MIVSPQGEGLHIYGITWCNNSTYRECELNYIATIREMADSLCRGWHGCDYCVIRLIKLSNTWNLRFLDGILCFWSCLLPKKYHASLEQPIRDRSI